MRNRSTLHGVRFVGRVKTRNQITTDGLRLYLDAAQEAFGADGVGLRNAHQDLWRNIGKCDERRYSPAQCGIGAEENAGRWQPRYCLRSTSYVERREP